MANIQVLRGTSVTVTETFRVDGTPNDLDSGVPTVVAKFPDGTALTPAPVASGAWTGRTTGQYRIVLHAQPEVTYLDPITWVGTIGGEQQTLYSRVEWVGEHLFNIADLRAVKVGDGLPFTSTAYSDSVVMARRVEVTDDFEARTGWSFVPRYTRERLTGDLTSTLILRAFRTPTLLSVTVDGTLQTLSGFDLTDNGILTWSTATFPSTRPNNVIVEYVRGLTVPSAAISSAALARAAMLLMPSVSSTVSGWTTPDGTSYSYDQAGQTFGGGGRRHYGVPGIDSVLNDQAYKTRGGVFA
jgi:hypothetical protein